MGEETSVAEGRACAEVCGPVERWKDHGICPRLLGRQTSQAPLRTGWGWRRDPQSSSRWLSSDAPVRAGWGRGPQSSSQLRLVRAGWRVMLILQSSSRLRLQKLPRQRRDQRPRQKRAKHQRPHQKRAQNQRPHHKVAHQLPAPQVEAHQAV